MNKKTYFLILILVVVATYLAYIAIFKAPPKNPNTPPTVRTVPVYDATLSMNPNPLVVSPLLATQQSSVDVVLDTATLKATAVQLELSYDPKVLSNVDVKPGPFFPSANVLIKTIDQQNGRISYAVGIQPQDTGKTGTGTVATISFTVNTQAAKVSQITFLPKTLVTAEGITSSVLKSSSGTSILFQTQGATTTAPANSSSSAQ